MRLPFLPISTPFDGSRMAGAAAIVLQSLFEEQITEACTGRIGEMDPVDPRFSDLLRAYPNFTDYAFTPDQYLDHIRKVKEATAIPVIASLNGMSSGVWLKSAELIQDAGADGLEVNFYPVPAELDAPGVVM